MSTQLPVLRNKIPIGQTARWCPHCGSKEAPPIERMKPYIVNAHSLSVLLQVEQICNADGTNEYVQGFDKQKGESGPGRLLSHATGKYHSSIRYVRTHTRHLWYMGLFDGKMFDEDECGVRINGWGHAFLTGQLVVPRSVKPRGGRIVAYSIECAAVHAGAIVDAGTLPNTTLNDNTTGLVVYSHPWPKKKGK